MGVFPLWYMVINKTLLATLGLVMTLGMRPLYRRLRRQHPSFLRILLASVVCSYGVSLVWTACFTLLIMPYNAWLRGMPFVLERWSILFEGSLYHAFVLMAWSVLYFAIKDYQALQVEKERVLKAEAAAQRARLLALRYQLNPHFLFNTLNAISTLVVEEQNRVATRMIARLSDFLRLTLESAEAQEVPLVEEIDFARRYLEIEQLRFGDRLTVRFDVEPETYAALVPNLILQPLVENAVRHAVAPREEGGAVTITAQRVDAALCLRVCDDGPGLADDLDEAAGRGVGLANTCARLRELYGDTHRLALQRSDGGGLTVTLTLPFRMRPEPSSEAPGLETPTPQTRPEPSS
jgi:signal transduction histidine kinase